MIKNLLKNKQQLFFICFLLLVSLLSNAQENCNNGIDDDGDGKIDLNDSDCVCNTTATSIIPNSSFESYTSCPYDISELNVATSWEQATTPTTDYFNTCGYVNNAGMTPFPDGNGAVGTFFCSNWQEYLGACLNSPMIAGTNYQLSFYIASKPAGGDVSVGNGGVITYGPIDIVLYGKQACTTFPLSTTGCPSSQDSSWIVLGKVNYTPVGNWGVITILFTPTVNINTVILGSPCTLPPEYAFGINPDGSGPYFYFDNLLLNTAASFGVNVNQTGNFCDNNLVLNANLTTTVGAGATYQWYHNGIAIVGATGLTYNVPSGTGNLGNYSVKVTDGTRCFISANTIVSNIIPAPNYTTIQPTCVVTTGSITITTSAAQYSFDNGATWQTSPTKNLLPVGIYYIKIKTTNGCVSSSATVSINQPELLGSSDYTVVQPTTCGGTGTITITSSSASEYSFDNGVTWTTNPVANLPPGEYNIKIKDAAGCQSTSQYVVIYPIYLDTYPAYVVVQPECGTGGTITITTSAAEYSFDDGVTWTTNPVATNLVPGYYFIKIKNSAGCVSYSLYIEIYTAHSDILPQYSIVQPGCGTNGSITITTAAAEYSFDGGYTWTTNPVANNLQPGYYYIMIKDATGCTSDYQYVYLEYYYLPNPEFTAVNPSCGNTGSITITTIADEYSFDGGYTWTTNPVANNLQSGYYNVMIRNTNGCQSDYSYVYLDSTYLANPNYTVVQPGCGTTGSITITTSAAEYSFDGGYTWTTNPVANNLQSGTYYIEIKNSAGCVSSYLYVYLDTFYLADPTFTITQPTCGSGGTISITTVATEYSFDGGYTWTTNPNATNLPPGYYYIQIRNSSGCISNTQYVYLDTYYLSSPLFTVTQPTCNTGGTITITTSAAEYSFDNGYTWTTNPVATNLPTGYYYILIKNNLGCVSNVEYVYLEQSYLPTPYYTVVQPSCTAGGTITITTSAAEYSFDNGVTWTTNPVATNLTSGYYYIMIKDALGCVSNVEYVYIDYYNSIPNAPIATIVQPSGCGVNNGSITITSYAISYSFDNGVTWVTNPTLGSLGNGTYLIKIKEESGGCASQTLTVILDSGGNAIPAPTYSVIQPSCALAFGSITITTIASEYSFDNGVTWTTNNSQTNLVAGTYQIKIKNTAGCISSNVTVIINAVPTAPNVPIVSITQPLNCSSSTGTITVTSTAAEYSFDDGVTWSTNPVSLPLTAGTYSVKIKGATGCISLATIAIINAPPNAPSAPIVTINQPVSCINPFGSILITSTAIQYSFDNGVTYTTNPNSGLLIPGNYQVRIKDSNGCESSATLVTIIPPSDYPVPPVISIIQPTCNNSQGQIIVTNSTTEYSFDNGVTWSTSATSTNLIPGTYYVKTKNALGCISNQTIAVINPFIDYPPLPSVAVQIFCIQDNAAINNINISGTNIKWYDALTGGNELFGTQLLQNGVTYYASQTIGGCESIRLPVLINIQNTIAPTGNNAESFCSSSNPTLNSILVSGLNIKWYDSATGGNLLIGSTPIVNGATYYASQTINGCESILRLSVTVALINTLSANDFSETKCDNLNDGVEMVNLTTYNSSLISNPSICTFNYYSNSTAAENQDVSQQITNVSNYNILVGNNIIYVRINSNDGCFQIVKLQLTLISNPNITIPAIVPICENNSIVINAGSGFSNYLWSTGATTQSIVVTAAGNYSVTVTQNNGSVFCSSTKNFEVVLSNRATITNIEIRDWTDNDNVITIQTSGLGDYEYSLDGINYQDSNVFSGLSSGVYEVYVKDKNDCGIVKDDVYLLMYPKFFTPNNDGYNDTWSIDFSRLERGLKVEIFDRYGKFIKELYYNTSWDGTYNGAQLPSTDYWFVVTRANGKVHKGHFAMKR